MSTVTIVIDESLLLEAVKTWGVIAQATIAMEECAEFITAISQYQRGRLVLDNVVEEVADVIIMMLQMRLILGTERVDAVIKQKMKRLKERLE